MQLKPRLAQLYLALFTSLLIIGFFQFSAPRLLPHNPQTHDTQSARSYVSVETINEKGKPADLDINLTVRVRTIQNINLPEQSFSAEGFYWLQWGQEVQDMIARHKIALDGIVEIVNLVDRDSTVIERTEVISRQNGGRKVYSLSVFYSGKFFIPNVNLENSPFDRLILPIIIEVDDSELSSESRFVSLSPELNTTADPIAGEFSNISGFRLIKTSWQRAVASYLSSPDAPTGSQTRYSRATALFTYDPGFWAVFVQWILPLVVVMGIVVMAPSLDGKLGDSRLAIPTAALLTLIFLHLGYKASFPEVPYLTYLDQLYAYSYCVCILIYILFVLSSNAHSRGNRVGDGGNYLMQQDRFELIVQVSIVVGYVCVAVLGWHA
ncbi:hypothetical protein KBY58_00395 [Cyanobium sp. HWJ4-Hawea]|uniref:hypothetical protein n=1 Tax=Cyanobium sp. HWJ4-Hawea TaxID=2823713 RepID=UPI0020CC3BB6|nr:hypothetical protein [Cyanobium sp. HWJ4-Hawea]MCP9807895.1 hypothetical protein [Cyanobium sp. HWJ4-Hawea]